MAAPQVLPLTFTASQPAVTQVRVHFSDGISHIKTPTATGPNMAAFSAFSNGFWIISGSTPAGALATTT